MATPGRQKTPPAWVDHVRTTYKRLMNEGKRHSARAVVTDLELEYGPAGCPSERTVYRLLREFDGLKAEEQRDYSDFRWPLSMDQRALPWEASSTLLELQRHLGRGRIPVRYARWFWRVTQAFPDTEIGIRCGLASHLDIMELGTRTPRDSEALHWLATYRPWRSDGDKEAYAKAGVPTLSAMKSGMTTDDVEEFIGAIFGTYKPRVAKVVKNIVETGSPGAGVPVKVGRKRTRGRKAK